MGILTVPNISDFYPILSKLDLQGLRKKSIKFSVRMRAVMIPIIEERRNFVKANSFRHNDFLDTLLDSDFSDQQIFLLFMELFSAGTDTTKTTIEWTMAELLKNPESMKRVRAEIEAEITQAFPKDFHKMQLPYLQACIKESMRLHPATTLLLPHRSIESCQVMNYTIPKNA
ncbi:hypothetical protein RD792_005677 [Penstemon davidsonii]|uniref:Cytochrome P450 n=1 Tax=Penstemon davidsonii TaxID=160366 RepID=A0ABR0DF36_9LAMI|nr:hypothetical protein RD792_005677 [Penstemon davidsonii]